MRACSDLGIRTVAVFSEADKKAPYLKEADETYHIGPSNPVKSYLNIDALIDAAKKSGADAVHPGYGFLSENASFAEAVVSHGITWVGPSLQSSMRLNRNVTAEKSPIIMASLLCLGR